MPLQGVLGLGGALSNTSVTSLTRVELFDVTVTGTVDDFDTPAPDGGTYRNLVWSTPGTFSFEVRGDGSAIFLGDIFVLGGGGAGGDIDVDMGPTLGNSVGATIESSHNVYVGGGGGAGSYDQDINVEMPADDTYTIVVGDGGSGQNNPQFYNPANGPGENSSFSNDPGTISFLGYGGNHGFRISADNPNPDHKGPPGYDEHGQAGGQNYGIDQFGNRIAVPCPGRGFPGNERHGMDPDLSGGYIPFYISASRPPTVYGQPETTEPPFIQRFEQYGTCGHSGAGAGYIIGSLRYTGQARRNAIRAADFGNPYTLNGYDNPAPSLFDMEDTGMDGGDGFPAQDVVFGGWDDGNRYASKWGGGGGGGYNCRPEAGGINPGSWRGGRAGPGGGGKGGSVYSEPPTTPRPQRITGRNASAYGAGGGGGGVARFEYGVYQSEGNTGSSQGGKGGNGSKGIVILRYIRQYD